VAATQTSIIPSLRIRVTPEQQQKLTDELDGVRDGARKAINGAINKLLPRVRTRVTNELGDLLTAKKNNIRNRITVRKSTAATLSGSVNILLRQIALVNFKNKDTRTKAARKKFGSKGSGRGVDVQIYKAGPTINFPHAFVATGKRDQAGGVGNKHIFQRVSNAAGRMAPRFPIVSLKGISLMKEFERRPDMQRRIQDFIADDLPRQLDSQVNRLLKRPKQFTPDA
jgi:hypothetical protein